MDINFFYNQNLQLYSQIEYTDPPIIGNYNNQLNESIKKLYLEYIQSRYNIKIGDLNYLSGYGLAINTYQNHSLDFDNMLRGLEFSYNLNDYFTLSTLIGNDRYDFWSSVAMKKSDLFYEIDTKFIEIQYNGDLEYSNINLYNIFYSFLYNDIKHNKNQLELYDGIFPNKIINEYIGSTNVNNNKDNLVDDQTHSFGMQLSFLEADIYIENTFIYLTQINLNLK